MAAVREDKYLLAIDAAASAMSNSLGISNLGNTSGMSGVVSGTGLQYLFAGGNNVTLSQSIDGASATVTISAGGGAGSNTFGMSNLGNTSGTSGVISGSDVRYLFAGGNNITLSQSINGVSGTITISAPNAVAQSVQTQGMVSVQGSTGAISFGNANGITFGGNASTLTASHNALTAQSTQPVAVSGSNGSFAFSTLTAGNLNGLSFYTSNGSLVGSYTVPNVPAQTVQPVAVSGSNGSFAFSTLTAGNLNGLSFYTSNGSLVGSYTVPNVPAQSNQTLGAYAIGNTTQSSSGTFDARSMSVVGGGLVSIGHSNGSLLISATAGGGLSNINLSAGTTSQNLSKFEMANSNGVSFGLNGSTITATVKTDYQTSGAYLTTAMQSNAATISNINLSAGTTSQNLSRFEFANGSNVSFGLSGSTVTASVLAQSVQTQNAVQIQGSTSNVSFGNANGITFGGNASTITASHNGLTSQSNQALSGSNGSFTFQTATLGNLNGLSFYTSNGSMVGSYTVPNVPAQSTQPVAISGSNGSFAFSTLTAGNLNGLSFYTSNGSLVGSYTVPNVPAQSNQTLGMYGLGNTTQGSSGTFDARSMSMVGGGMVSVGYSNGSVLISATAAAGGGITNINLSAGTTSQNLSKFEFANSNGVSFGLNGSTLTASHNALTSQSNQAISGSNGSFTFQTATFGNLNGMSFYTSNGSLVASYTVPSGGAGAAVSIRYFEPPDIEKAGLMTNITGISSRPIFQPFTLGGQLTNSSMVLQMSRAATGSNAFTVQAGIYTYVNETSFSLLGSLSNVFSNTATASVSNAQYFVLSGWDAAVTNMTPGAYILGLNFFAAATASMNYSLLGAGTASNPIGAVLAGSNSYQPATSFGHIQGWGRYTAQSGSLPTAFAQSNIIANFSGASMPLAPWFALRA